jgi:hypothetical protein
MINPQAIPRAYKRVEEISTRNETLGASLQCGGRQRALSPSHSGMSVRLVLSLSRGPGHYGRRSLRFLRPAVFISRPAPQKSSWTEIALGRGKHTLDECRHSQKILSERTAQHSKAREAALARGAKTREFRQTNS